MDLCEDCRVHPYQCCSLRPLLSLMVEEEKKNPEKNPKPRNFTGDPAPQSSSQGPEGLAVMNRALEGMENVKYLGKFPGKLSIG